ncbi:DivIVA domain-containing protein [Desulfococcaceae bacterium HSG7]|nr:DivIVA domain-containing protein [Desulfococcaceae bacterium HSG9]MDM8556894.1 DivIVA domain-containing protein [Desulfococcaceae bacterium HSG7]
MLITSFDIRERRFKVRFRGFDVREVDSFLEHMADSFIDLENRNENLEKEILRLKTEINKHPEHEETLKQVMQNSQKVLDQMKKNAHQSAEMIVADAEIKAGKMLNKAHNRLAQLHEDITELKRQRLQIEMQIRSIIETHSRLLEMGKEEEGFQKSNNNDQTSN